MYDSRIVGIAINGTKDYAEEAVKENAMLDETADKLESIVANLKDSGSTETISTDTSYTGYYADIDKDGDIDGIIFADLAVGGSGKWNSDSWSSYSYETQTGLKEYEISGTYEGAFGTKDILTSVSGTSGNDRFYVMALEDVDSNYHNWYYSAYGNLDSAYNVSSSTNDFGEGKANTIRMINAWNEETYGTQNGGTTYNLDLWGLIQDSTACSYDIITSASDSGKWFVPSKAEWAAFGDAFNVSKTSTDDTYYVNYGLSNNYWSSSQLNTLYASTAAFGFGFISNARVDNSLDFVRLAATF